MMTAPVRAVRSFLPGSQPLLSRQSYTLELTTAGFFALALAAIESGVISVFAKQTFEGVVSERTLNFTVAALGSMDALANILSFVWLSGSHGRPKVPFINALQVVVLVCIVSLALIPRTPAGLGLLVFAVLTARTCWSGIVMLRSTVWRANYARAVRASIIGRVSTLQVLVVAGIGALLGSLLDRSLSCYQICLPVVVALAMVAVGATGRLRVRRERALLRAEREGPRVLPPWKGPLVVLQVLRRDPWYSKFMLWMFVLGFGNIMVTPVLAIMLRDQFGVKFLASILVTSTIPFVVQAMAIPAWARLLDRAHVVRFRSIHAWCFAAAGIVMVLASAMHRVELLYVSAVMLGVAFAGGTLAWNLGHVDFSPPGETGRYMATHVTLNGLRGLLAPLASVVIYEAARSAGWNAPLTALGVSLVVSIAGAAGFVLLRAQMGTLGSTPNRHA